MNTASTARRKLSLRYDMTAAGRDELSGMALVFDQVKARSSAKPLARVLAELEEKDLHTVTLAELAEVIALEEEARTRLLEAYEARRDRLEFRRVTAAEYGSKLKTLAPSTGRNVLFLLSFLEETKSINPNALEAYRLKHLIELHTAAGYLTTEQLHSAMAALGFKSEIITLDRDGNPLDWRYNISRKSVALLEKILKTSGDLILYRELEERAFEESGAV